MIKKKNGEGREREAAREFKGERSRTRWNEETEKRVVVVREEEGERECVW